MKTINLGISLFILAMLGLISCREHGSGNPSSNKADSTETQKRKHWLKQYALCDCIKYGFPKDTTVWNDPSGSVLREISDFNDPIIYAIVDSSSAKAAINIKPLQVADYNRRKAVILGCMNFYESKMLDSLINRIDKIYQEREKKINK